MEQLGYLDDPADRLGMLDGQRLRAARVVLDIGVHLGKPRLDGTGTWDAAYALEFLRGNVNMSDQFVQFEVNRYLGWPGQAPSYKVGQRIWEQVRDAVRAAEGSPSRSRSSTSGRSTWAASVSTPCAARSFRADGNAARPRCVHSSE